MPQPCTGHGLRQLIKKSTFPTDLRDRLGCVGQQCCMVLQEARKSPALLTSRFSLWEKRTSLVQRQCFLVIRVLSQEASPRSQPAQIHFQQQQNCPNNQFIVKATFSTLCGGEDAKVNGEKKEKDKGKRRGNRYSCLWWEKEQKKKGYKQV